MAPPDAPGPGAAQSGGCALPAAQLVTRCDPDTLGFDTTADLPDGDTPFGQTRAVDAIQKEAKEREEDRKSVV